MKPKTNFCPHFSQHFQLSRQMTDERQSFNYVKLINFWHIILETLLKRLKQLTIATKKKLCPIVLPTWNLK